MESERGNEKADLTKNPPNEKKEVVNEELQIQSKESIQRQKMDLLHKYNDIKDATQVVLGAIANIEGVTVKELHNHFQLPLTD